MQRRCNPGIAKAENAISPFGVRFTQMGEITLSHRFIWHKSKNEIWQPYVGENRCNVQRCNATLLQYPRCNITPWYLTCLGTISPNMWKCQSRGFAIRGIRISTRGWGAFHWRAQGSFQWISRQRLFEFVHSIQVFKHVWFKQGGISLNVDLLEIWQEAFMGTFLVRFLHTFSKIQWK